MTSVLQGALFLHKHGLIPTKQINWSILGRSVHVIVAKQLQCFICLVPYTNTDGLDIRYVDLYLFKIKLFRFELMC